MVRFDIEKSSLDCVHFFKNNELPEIEKLMNGVGLLVAELDANLISNEQDLFVHLANALNFPDYFGKNWDALDECLQDMSWVGDNFKGCAMLVRNSKSFWNNLSIIGGRFISAWIIAAEVWQEEDKPFYVLFGY